MAVCGDNEEELGSVGVPDAAVRETVLALDFTHKLDVLRPSLLVFAFFEDQTLRGGDLGGGAHDIGEGSDVGFGGLGTNIISTLSCALSIMASRDYSNFFIVAVILTLMITFIYFATEARHLTTTTVWTFPSLPRAQPEEYCDV